MKKLDSCDMDIAVQYFETHYKNKTSSHYLVEYMPTRKKVFTKDMAGYNSFCREYFFKNQKVDTLEKLANLLVNTCVEAQKFDISVRIIQNSNSTYISDESRNMYTGMIYVSKLYDSSKVVDFNRGLNKKELEYVKKELVKEFIKQ